MNAWKGLALLCGAVVLTQSALELYEACNTAPASPAPAQVTIHMVGPWQAENTYAVSLCEAAVDAMVARTGLTVQDMDIEPVKGLVARANRECIIKNGLSI